MNDIVKTKHDFKCLLKGLVEHLPSIFDIPNISTRLTIYQIEEELNQLIWHGKKQEEVRISRLGGWLEGQLERLLMDFLTAK